MPKTFSAEEALGLDKPQKQESNQPKTFTAEEALGIYPFSNPERTSQDELRAQLESAQKKPEAGLGAGIQTYIADVAESIPKALKRGFAQAETSRALEGGYWDAVAKQQRKLKDIGEQSASMQKMTEASGLLKTIGAFLKDPIQIGNEGVAESLSALIPTLARVLPARASVGAGIGAGVGAPVAGIGAIPGAIIGASGGAMEATGRASYELEYAGKFLEELSKAGYDVTDAGSIRKALSDKPLIERISNLAHRKALAIGAVDAASGIVGGKLITKPATSLAREIGRWAGEVAIQGAMGAGGEASGELASGEKLDWPSIVLEGVVEPFGSAHEVALGAVTHGKQPAPRKLNPLESGTGLPDSLQGLPEPTVTLRKKRETKPRLTLKNEQAKAATEKTSIGFRILSKRGVDSDVATAVVNLVGEKQSDETAEQYRERINAAHDNAGFKSVQELALPFAPEQRIRDEMTRLGESQDAIEQSVKTANDARIAEANKVRESNNKILRALQFSIKKPITPTKGRANAQSPRTEIETPGSQQIVEQGEEERLRLRDAEKNRVETKVAEAPVQAEAKPVAPEIKPGTEVAPGIFYKGPWDTGAAVLEGYDVKTQPGAATDLATFYVLKGASLDDVKKRAAEKYAEFKPRVFEPQPDPHGVLPSGERIVATAVRAPDGRVISSPNKIHPQLWEEAGVDMGSLTAKQIREDNGFLTDSGRFVTSREAESSSAARTYQKQQAVATPTPPTEKALTEAKPVDTTTGVTTETESPISVSEPDVQSSTPVERQDNAGRAGAKPALESISPQPPVSPTEVVSKPLPPERAGASTTITPETAPLPTPVVSSKPEPKKQVNRASDFKVKDAQLTTEEEVRDRLKSVNRRREEGNWTPAKDAELKKLSKRAGLLESRLADILRNKIRAKQDEVIAIAERRGMDEDTPISSVQEQAPTIKELRAKIWPNFESSLDAFLSEFKQAEPTQSQSQLQAEPEITTKQEKQSRASEIKSTLDNWASKIDEARKGRNYSGLFGVDAVLYDAGLLAARNILQSQTFQSAAVAFDAAVQAAMKAIHSMLEGQLRLRPDLVNSYKEDEMEAAIREGLRQTQHESIPPPAPPEVEQAVQEQETQIDNAGQTVADLQAEEDNARIEGTKAVEDSDKSGDTIFGERVKTMVMGVQDTVQGGEGLNEERRQQGVAFAKSVFDQVGVRTVWDEKSGLWVLDPKWVGSDEAGRALRDRIEEEVRRTRSRNYSGEQGDFLGNLLNSTRVAMTGDAVTQFSPAVKNELYAIAQGEASFRGLLLAALRAMDHSISYMSRNVESALYKIRFDALGGEQITQAMREAMAFFKKEVLGENGNQKLFTDAELEELIKKMPKLQAEFERLLNEKRGEHGSRLYRAVQSLYTPHKRKKLAALEADAELQEAIAKIVEDLKQRGIAPVAQVSNKLTPLKELLHMVDTTKDPTAQQAINDAINAAIGEAEINAGIDATLAAIKDDPQFTTNEQRIEAAKELRALFESGELVPEKEMVEAGLNLPKYLHWKNLRDNLTGYSPITVKLARKVITGDFRGTKFASETPPAADTRTLDFNKLAISPEAEVRRVFDNWMAELDAKMDLVNATPETRQGVMDVLKAEISDQYEKAKLRARESYFAAPKTSRPSPQDKLAQAINAGLFGDQRLNLDNLDTRDAFIANVASKSAVRKLTPSLRSLIQDVLKTPYYKRQDLADAFAASVVKYLRVSPDQAKNAADVFIQAYNNKWAKAAQVAILKAKNALVGTQQKEARVRSKQGVWDKLVKAANSGYLDVGEVLRAEAKVRGWWEPSDQQIADVRELAFKLQRLSDLTPKEKLEIEAAVEQARAQGKSLAEQETLRQKLTKDKLANVSSGVTDQRTIIKKKMELFWSKVSRPINYKTAEGRANAANFALEYSAAGMLTTPGFVVRQMLDVITQGLMHSPTRAFGMALEQRRKDLEAGDATNFWRDALDNVRASFKARNSSIKDRLSAVAYTLRTGTNDLRNVERILSGIATFERVEEKVEELKKQGRNELALMLYIASMNKFAYRFAGAMDNLHGIPAEYQEIRLLVESKLRENGMTVEEARKKADWVMGDNQKDWMLAMHEASEILAERPRLDGKPHSASDLQSAAGHIVRGMKYQRIGELGIDATDFQERLRLLRNTLGWNEREEGGFGGMAAKGVAVARRGFASMGIPVPSANFGNAIGIGINKVLTWATPIAATNWGQETFFGVDPKAIKQGTVSDTGSPFYRTPEDRAQRKIEAIVGSTTGAMVFTLAMLGFIAVRNKWPKDKEERDEWERLGLKPGTFDIPAGNGKVLTMSMTTGPFMIVRPWLAAGGAIQDLLKDRAKAQARLDLEAARKGLPAGKIKPIEFMDLIGVAGQAAWAAVGGGRTASGMLGSISDFGQFDLKKAIAGQIAPFVPFLPGLRDISRLTGTRADSRFASFTDMLLPLPTSGAAQVNFLGDRVGSGNDLARIIGQLSGGNVPWPRNVKEDEQTHAYKIVFGTEYRPPSINTAIGRNINGEFRPLNNQELVRYTKLRGQYFKEELNTLPLTATAGQAKIAYQRANERALSEIGVTPSGGGFGGTLRTSATRPAKAPRMAVGASLPSRRKTTAFKRYATRGPSRRTRLSLGVRRPRLTASRRTVIRKLSLRRPRLRLYA